MPTLGREWSDMMDVQVPSEQYARCLLDKASARSIIQCIVEAKDNNDKWLLGKAIEFAREYLKIK